MQQIIEKRKEHNVALFLDKDKDKAYDSGNRDKMWGMVGNKIPNYLLNKMKCIYMNTMARIKFHDAVSETIHTNKGVRKGCGLSPLL